MKKFIICTIFFSLFPLTIKAATLSIEPTYAIERTQRQYPEPAKYVTKTYIGLRAVYGVPLISTEFEVSQSFGQDDFPAQSMSVSYTTQRAMLGIRLLPFHSKYVGVFFRTGARAQKEIREITQSAEKTKEESPINLDPYAGAGFTLAFNNNFALSAGATLLYNRDAGASEQYDTQYSFSFTIRVGNK